MNHYPESQHFLTHLFPAHKGRQPSAPVSAPLPSYVEQILDTITLYSEKTPAERAKFHFRLTRPHQTAAMVGRYADALLQARDGTSPPHRAPARPNKIVGKSAHLVLMDALA